MKILYIAEEIELPGFHGGSTHVQETINALRELNHQVFVICKMGKNQKERETIKKVNYIRLNFDSNPILKNIYLFTQLESLCKKIIKENEIDLIWQRNRIFGGQGIIAGKKLGKKTLLELNEPIETSDNSKFYPLIKKWFYYTTNYADLVTGTHSTMLKNIKSKKVLIHYGANIKIFNPKNTNKLIKTKLKLKGKTLLYCGSFQEWHCISATLYAFKDIKKRYKNSSFLLIGEGPKKESAKKLCTKLKLKDVHFLGKIKFEELPKYINSVDICFALFDRNQHNIKKYGYYYSPIKIHEYKACGKPVIASNIGNLNTLVKNNLNGVTVNENNLNSIIKSIERLLTNKQLVKKIKKQNIKEAREEYNWQILTKNILEEFK